MDLPMTNEGAETVAVPGFQAGGSLDAIISGARAVARKEASTSDGQVINYYFPIEVEVVASASDDEMQLIARYVCNVLNAALRNRD